MDVFAAEIGMDPVEVRRTQLHPPGSSSRSTPPTGAAMDSGEYDRGARPPCSRPPTTPPLRAEQERRRATADEPWLGLGWSTYVEIANPMANAEFGSIEIRPDGSAIVLTGSSVTRPGPPHRLRPGRQRHHRHPVRQDRGSPRRHRRGRPRRRHRRLEVAPGRRQRRLRRPARTSSSRPRRSPPTCSRPAPTTSCSTPRPAGSPWPAPRSCRVDWARSPRDLHDDDGKSLLGRGRLPAARARRSRSGPTSRWSRSTATPGPSRSCVTSPATTPARWSTRCSSTARSTVASPPASPRR